MMRRGRTRAARRFAKCDRGAALAEFALVLPLLVVLLGAVIEITRGVYQYHVVAKGVQDAARFLSRREEVVEDGNCPPGGNWSTAEALARNLALTGSTSGSDYTMAHWNDPNTITVTVNCTSGSTMVSPLASGAGATIPIVEVTARVPFNDIGLLGFLGIEPLTISATHSEMGVGG
jgi:Flp pilus assembly protein TadG